MNIYLSSRILIVFTFLFVFTNNSTAQTSHPSGFYPEIDSLFFTVHWETNPNEQLQWSINRFSEDSWKPYNGGVWLKKRPELENTWEDITYTDSSCSSYGFIDTTRGPLRKVNILRVRIINTISSSITKDSVYIIGFNNFPSQQFIFFCHHGLLRYGRYVWRL
jgi:hypothetical protein